MFTETPTGFVRKRFPMSDVIAYQADAVFLNLIKDLRGIDPALICDEPLDGIFEAHRADNLRVMEKLARQAPRMQVGDPMSWDLDRLLEQAEHQPIRVHQAMALGSYTARSALEAAHMTASFLSDDPKRAFLCILNTMRKIHRPIAAEWLDRARKMIAPFPALAGTETWVRLVRDEAVGDYVLRVDHAAIREVASRQGPVA